MPTQSTKSSSFFLPIVLLSILFLFFFQLLTDFVGAVYAFGLLQVEIPIESAFVLLLLSPVLLVLFPRRLSTRRALLALAGLVLICRVVEVLLDTRGQMIVAGIGTGAFLIFLPAFLAGQSRSAAGSHSLAIGLGVMFAVALSMLFRALNSTVDLSAYGVGQIIAWALAVVAGRLMFAPSAALTLTRADESTSTVSKGRVTAYSWGFVSVLVLLYFAFTAPQVIARWTDVSALPVLMVLVIALCLFVVVVRQWVKREAISALLILGWNALFVVALTATIALHQMNFPIDRGAYPIFETAARPWQIIPVGLTLILFPIVLVDLSLFARQIIEAQATPRTLALGFSVAALWALILIFANVSTTVYDYLPIFGPLWRDRYWLVFLLAGLGMVLPLLLMRTAASSLGPVDFSAKISRPMFGAMLLIGLGTLIGAWWNEAKPIAPLTTTDTLKVMTYNIQQGYDARGLKNYDGQLALMRRLNPDLIGLQESDTSRIADGNSDVVRYFADRLGMYSYYGPKTVLGTFGIALLSRYPIGNPRTFYMYSLGEQTATIVVEITVGGKTYHAMVTHLGNGGPLPQLEDILKTLDGKQNIVLMGDFNFEPTTDQYRQATAVLADAWVRAGAPTPIGAEWNAAQRIDHVFVSSGVEVVDAQYVLAPTSDHPAVMVEVK